MKNKEIMKVCNGLIYSGHVALYIGGGQIIHASNPSDGIKISPATYTNILAVRRVLG